MRWAAAQQSRKLGLEQGPYKKDSFLKNPILLLVHFQDP